MYFESKISNIIKKNVFIIRRLVVKKIKKKFFFALI